MIPAEMLRKIRRIEIRTSRIVSEALGGQFRSAFKGRGMEFEEVRPYQIGDDVRTIDWNVSARIGEPHIKLFREERELTVLLVVDVSASLDFGTRSQRKRELVAEVAATLAFSAIRSNDKAGLLCFSDRIDAASVSVPGPPSHPSAAPCPPDRWSRPAWPKSESLPLVPSRRSLPPAPLSVSAPAPPSMRSLPGPSRSRSLPRRPAMLSAPPRPSITSDPGVPVIVSLPSVP